MSVEIMQTGAEYVWLGLVSRCLPHTRCLTDDEFCDEAAGTRLKAAPSQIVNILSNHNKWQGIVNKRDTLNKLRHTVLFSWSPVVQMFQISINYQP